jgi:ankyrin repeat protein
MSVLLQPDELVEENGARTRSPLAGYAAQYWVTHAQFENVSSFLQGAMEDLFDLDKPFFAAWLQLHNIDSLLDPESSSLYWFEVSTKSGANPLYYAALCGFEDLVEHLAVKYPQHVNTRDGYYMTPLVAALAGGHFRTAKLLHHHGAHANVCLDYGRTPLHSAAWYGDLEMVRVLLDYKADVKARESDNWTPLQFVSNSGRPGGFLSLHSDVTRLLLEHGADVNARGGRHQTPLHLAVVNGIIGVEVVRVLLEHGANIGAENNQGESPLHEAADRGTVEVVRVLLEHGANVGAENNNVRTPFQIASAQGRDEIVKLLSEHSAKSVL